MRIVGGRHRGRVLDSPPDAAVRPTSDRARESLFNILEHGKFARGGLSPVRGSRVLDAFCGTGALGLEALSRGACFATFIDISPVALRLAQTSAKKLGEGKTTRFLQADATHPPRADAPCSLVFLDPPYGEGLAAPSLAALAATGWLANHAIIVVETATRDELAAPDGFTPADERRYGKAKLSFLLYAGGA